jgi:hypothetical protein
MKGRYIKVPEVEDRTMLEELTLELKAGRYRDIDEYKGIVVGSRVKHSGQKYTEAYVDGTATVLAIMESVNSAWSRKYGTRDVEFIILRDKPIVPEMSRVSNWASYRTELISGQ